MTSLNSRTTLQCTCIEQNWKRGRERNGQRERLGRKTGITSILLALRAESRRINVDLHGESEMHEEGQRMFD